MKKTLLALTLIIVLVSCKKEDTSVTQTNDPTFFRVEAVSSDGEVIYSEIKVIK